MPIDVTQVLAALDHERRHLVRRGEIAEIAGPVVRVRGADHSWHSVVWSSLTPDTTDAAILDQIEHHRRLGVSFEWKVYSHDAPADLRDRLGAAGLTAGPQEAVMVYDLSAGRLPQIEPAIRVRRVQTPEDVATFRSIAEAIFRKDYAFTAGQLRDAIAAGSTEHRGYIAYAADGAPAGIGRLYTHDRSLFGGLYGGGTVEACRRTGVYRAMIAARAADAIASGARYLIVDALPTSRPILQRLGFTHVSDTWPFDWQPKS